MNRQFEAARLRTVHFVPPTALDERGRLNLGLQQRHVAGLVAAGARVLMPAAGTGEFHSLLVDEIIDVVRATREAAGPEAIVFAPVGLQLPAAIDTAVRAVDAGADGILFMPLGHPYLCDVGAADYYRAVIERAGCPAIIYKTAPIPSDELLLEMVTWDEVVGVKYAVNNLHDFRRTVLAGAGSAEWLCGSAERFAPYFMLAGATGYTSGAGNLCPRLTLAMHAALAAGNHAEAMRLQKVLLPIEEFRGRNGDSYSISMLKHALREVSGDFGPPRPPQRQLTDGERGEIEQLIGPVLKAERQLASKGR